MPAPDYGRESNSIDFVFLMARKEHGVRVAEGTFAIDQSNFAFVAEKDVLTVAVGFGEEQIKRRRANNVIVGDIFERAKVNRRI